MRVGGGTLEEYAAAAFALADTQLWGNLRFESVSMGSVGLDRGSLPVRCAGGPERTACAGEPEGRGGGWRVGAEREGGGGERGA